jgi:hypothetical protein
MFPRAPMCRAAAFPHQPVEKPVSHVALREPDDHERQDEITQIVNAASRRRLDMCAATEAAPGETVPPCGTYVNDTVLHVLVAVNDGHPGRVEPRDPTMLGREKRFHYSVHLDVMGLFPPTRPLGILVGGFPPESHEGASPPSNPGARGARPSEIFQGEWAGQSKASGLTTTWLTRARTPASVSGFSASLWAPGPSAPLGRIAHPR